MDSLRLHVPLRFLTARSDAQCNRSTQIWAVGRAISRDDELLQWLRRRDSLHQMSRRGETTLHSHPKATVTIAAVSRVAHIESSEVLPALRGEIVLVGQVAVQVRRQLRCRAGLRRLMRATNTQPIETVSRQTGLLSRILHRDANEEGMFALERSLIPEPERIDLVRTVLRHFQRPIAAQLIGGNGQRVTAAGVGGTFSGSDPFPFYDLDSGAIVSVSKGRGQKALNGFFSRLKRAGVFIQAVATDMAGGYVAAVMKHLWPTQLIFDRFHVVKLMNEKLTTLRREMYRELKDVQQRDVLKGVRWLLLKNPENLKQTARVDERSRLAEALKLNEPLAQAYYLKDELRLFWQQGSKSSAAKFLDDWCRRAEATGIRGLRTMSHTLRGHRVGLLNWYDHPISTSPLEGTNNKIGLLQRRAYGYRRYDHFKLRLLTLHHTKFTLAG